MRNTLLLLVFSLFCSIGFGQNYHLVIDKNAGVKRTKIPPGSTLHFVLKDGVNVKGVLEWVMADAFSISGRRIQPDQVAYLQKLGFQKGLTRAFKSAAKASVPGMFVFESMHNLFNTGKRPLISKPTITLSSIFLGLGALDFIMPPRKIRFNKKRTLRILDLNPEG